MEEIMIDLPKGRSWIDNVFHAEATVITLDPEAVNQALFGKTSCRLYHFEGPWEAFRTELAAHDLQCEEMVFQLTQSPEMSLEQLERWANLIAEAGGRNASVAFGVEWSETLDEDICTVNILTA